jgi:DNA-binding NarL/FixJ family response regulator
MRSWGLLPVDVEPGELFAAIRALHAGMVVSRKEAFKAALEAPLAELDWADGEMLEALTDREQQVLELLARGLANKQIALALSISEHTVKFHISSIYGKFNASNGPKPCGRVFTSG